MVREDGFPVKGEPVKDILVKDVPMTDHAKNAKSYEKSTPVERVLKNVDKAKRAVGLAAKRMRAWAASPENGSTDPKVLGLVEEACQALTEASQLVHDSRGIVASLVEHGWQPPKNKITIHLAARDRVAIADAHLGKYSDAYDFTSLMNLQIDKFLKRGVVVSVVNREETFFIVPKGHLRRVDVTPSDISEAGTEANETNERAPT